MFEVTDTQKIGVGLAGFGIFFLFLGVVLIFDKSLLALGNILFISGLACVIGRERTFRFFFQRHKVKGSLAFFGGITIVLIGWPFVGMLVETYGFILLFSGFFPVAINFLRRVPILGTFLNFPGVSGVSILSLGHVIRRLDQTALNMNRIDAKPSKSLLAGFKIIKKTSRMHHILIIK
ncbi:hypothetical protein NQ314_021427 [Rhamnusium bicolor]|uniref:Vesicle transport protein GOT1B n=1 Tax=Rhamnusium bicolor TaxID=1586634 RepID=A0AAV8WIJ3_9CUCU|nr:hypothetical protein NQ314_021427 [Rhamnusium bicolor]